MNYGRIKNGVVVDVASDPSKQFHPILAAEFVEVPDDVTAGYTFDGTNYTPPVVVDVEPEQPVIESNKSISPIDFKLRFSIQERITIKALRIEDHGLDDFYELLDDPRLLVVNLDDETIVEAVTYTINALFDVGAVEDVETRISQFLGGGNVDA